MKINKGDILIRLDEPTTVKDGIALPSPRKSGVPMTGIVEMVGEPDEFGTPIWEIGDKVWAPAVGGQDIEHEGVKYRIVHHRRIIFGE